MTPSGGWWRLILWLLLAALALYVLRNISHTLSVFGLGFVLAYFLNGPVERITGTRLGPIRKLSRGQAIVVVYLILIAMLVAGASVLVPIAAEQVQAEVHQAPLLYQKIQDQAAVLQARYMNSVPPQVRETVEAQLASSADKLGAVLTSVVGWVINSIFELLGNFFLLLTGLLIAIYFLVGWYDLQESVYRMVPFQYKDDTRSLASQMNRIFGGYVRATFLSMCSCGALTLVLLLGLSLWYPNPYSLLLAFLACITYPIPVLGVAATTILSILLAYFSTNDITYTVVVALAVLLGNQIVDRTVYPKLMGDAIGVSALFILFAAFAGGEFLGTTGMLLGIPLAAMGKAVLTWIHARFLVVPETELHHSTRELWRRAAEVPARALPVEGASPVLLPLAAEQKAAEKLAEAERQRATEAAWHGSEERRLAEEAAEHARREVDRAREAARLEAEAERARQEAELEEQAREAAEKARREAEEAAEQARRLEEEQAKAAEPPPPPAKQQRKSGKLSKKERRSQEFTRKQAEQAQAEAASEPPAPEPDEKLDDEDGGLVGMIG